MADYLGPAECTSSCFALSTHFQEIVNRLPQFLCKRIATLTKSLTELPPEHPTFSVFNHQHLSLLPFRHLFLPIPQPSHNPTTHSHTFAVCTIRRVLAQGTHMHAMQKTSSPITLERIEIRAIRTPGMARRWNQWSKRWWLKGRHWLRRRKALRGGWLGGR